jgi:transposase
MAMTSRRQALLEAGLVHPTPEQVTAVAFKEHPEFFLALDKVQVKYEMLRAHVVDGLSVVAAAERHGYSRASFYLVQHAFERAGMAGLIDERPGRRGPLKLSAEVLAFLGRRARERPEASGAELAEDVERVLGVRLHRRTVERAVRALGPR